MDDARKGMENALKTNPLDVRHQYGKQLRDLQEAYGEAMLELRARKKLQALMKRPDQLSSSRSMRACNSFRALSSNMASP